MHPSAYAQMKLCIETYLRKDRHYRVVELGSRQVDASHLIHRTLLDDYDVDYTGVDVKAGRNVDRVMRRPYRVPVRSNTVDVVLTGQVFEHIPYPWASFLELARVLRPGGLIFMTVPSRGHKHGSPDCWRYYADSMSALAGWARMRVREVYTDLPPTSGQRIAYGEIDTVRSYWGDTVGVFEKPDPYSRGARLVAPVITWWANRVGDIALDTVPAPRPERARVLP